MHQQKGNLKRDILNNSKLYELIDSGTSRLSMIPEGISGQYNAMYGKDDFRNAMIGTALYGTNIASYVNQRYHADDMPSDEWFRQLFKHTKSDATMKLFTDIALDPVDRLYRQGHIPKKGVYVAIDIHDIPRYDKKHGIELAIGKYKNGTKIFERYITVQCVAGNIRQVLAVLSMKAMETSAEFVPKIMKIVKKIRDKIKIRCVIVYCGFFSVGTLNTLDSLGLTYLIPCKNTTNVIRALNEFAENKRDKVLEMELTSITRNSVKYVMKITERREKKNPKTPEEEYIGFATNDSTIDISIYSSR